ncbi:MAG: hypothetical protein J7M40_03825 [Planctomycetes bacterium]|nr:hypothetical protein [Planctomycetota bacterium]
MKRSAGATRTDILIGVVIAAAVGVAVYCLATMRPTGTRGSGLSTDFAYDIEKLAAFDPDLIMYDESAEPIATGFEKARAIAVDSAGRIYVAGDKAIKVFDNTGGLSETIAAAGEPRCLAVAADGLIYMGLGDHVEVYNSDTKRTSPWKSPGDSAVLTSIALSKEGDVFVADASNQIVIRYDKTGAQLNRIGEKDTERNVPGFVVPSAYFDVAVPRDGMLRVVNPGRLRVETYTFDGDFEFSWGKPSVGVEGFCGCCNPANIALLPNDDFVTCEKGLNRVKIYDHDGRFKGVVAGPRQLTPDLALDICQSPKQCRFGGFDVAADSKGTVYVLDTHKNMVRIFDPKEM